MWGPTSASGATGFVLTDAGHLLEGTLWSQLQAWLPAEAGSAKACAAVHPAAQLLARGCGQQLDIHTLDHSANVSIEITSQVSHGPAADVVLIIRNITTEATLYDGKDL